MSELDCIICSDHFNGDVNLPRMLHCGHTLCTQCLGNILAESKLCPSCRKETTNVNVDDYPVNYIVMEIIDSKTLLGLKHTKDITQVYQEKVKRRQEEHLELRSAVEFLKDNIDKSLEFIKTNEEQLNLISTMVVSDPSHWETRSKIKVVDERFDTICSQIHISYSPLIKGVSFKSEDFKSVEDFLQEIHKVIMVERKMMAAVLRIEGVKQFAELSIRDDLLFTHSFERYQEKYHDVNTVCFQDFRTVLLRDGKAGSIFGFLDLNYNANKFSRRVIIEPMLSNSCPGSQFLKLCTGEFGISYKGLKYEQLYGEVKTVASARPSTYLQDFIIKVNTNSRDITEMDCFSAFFLEKKDNKFSGTSDVIYVSFFKNWSFNIFRFNYNGTLQYPNIIGTVIDLNKDFAKLFKDASFRKIIDCGMAVKI